MRLLRFGLCLPGGRRGCSGAAAYTKTIGRKQDCLSRLQRHDLSYRLSKRTTRSTIPEQGYLVEQLVQGRVRRRDVLRERLEPLGRREAMGDDYRA